MGNLLERCFFPENQLNVFYLLAPQFFPRSVARVADVQQVREMNREGGGWSGALICLPPNSQRQLKQQPTTIKKTTPDS